MASIISALIIILLILLFTIFAAWIDRFGEKRKAKLLEKYFHRVEQHVGVLTEINKVGPWYLVVFTVTSPYPIWISNNNIRSVHPDPSNCRLIVKLFNGEDMVIEDVESYDLQAGNEMLNYDFE